MQTSTTNPHPIRFICVLKPIGRCQFSGASKVRHWQVVARQSFDYSSGLLTSRGGAGRAVIGRWLPVRETQIVLLLSSCKSIGHFDEGRPSVQLLIRRHGTRNGRVAQRPGTTHQTLSVHLQPHGLRELSQFQGKSSNSSHFH